MNDDEEDDDDRVNETAENICKLDNNSIMNDLTEIKYDSIEDHL